MDYPNSNGHSRDPRLGAGNFTKPPPMLPPPPGVPYPYSVESGLPSLPPPKTADELFVENFQLKISASYPVSIPVEPKRQITRISIHESKNSLRKCFEIMSRFEQMQAHLTEHMETMPSDEWKKHTIGIGTLKDELSSVMSQFRNPEVVKALACSVKRRARKRLAMKQKRIADKKELLRRKQEESERHKEMDLWLAKKQEEVERAKAEEMMKRDADNVLAEVTRKKTDARKQLSLIASLIKLRTVRQTAALARGEKIPEEDNVAFCKTTEMLVKQWENSMKVYSKEEQGLKLMLEENAEKDSKLAEENKERMIGEQWDEVLFGPNFTPSPSYWPLTAAQRDMEKFVAIRKSWDTFLACYEQKGSRIPMGWVLPPVNPISDWSIYKKA